MYESGNLCSALTAPYSYGPVIALLKVSNLDLVISQRLTKQRKCRTIRAELDSPDTQITLALQLGKPSVARTSFTLTVPQMINRWLSARFELLSALAVLSATLVALFGWIDAGWAGLTITFAMSFGTYMYWACGWCYML